VRLSAEQRREIEDLARRFGVPRRVDVAIRGDFDPVQKNRLGEVCMVIRRPNGKILLSIKTFYPRGAYRLPTGGIHDGERVLDAVLREAKEETDLETEPRRFLAAIDYRDERSPAGEPIFHTYAFLLDEVGGNLGMPDALEQIEEWVEVDPGELPAVAERLDSVTSAHSDDIGGDWADWGRFRAIVHRVVHEALQRS
jgi:NAD+ diphosphatase